MPNYAATVRYGLMAVTERFAVETDEYRIGDDVIVRTARGIDYGEVMSRPVPPADGAETQGELLRPANGTDRKIIAHIREAREPEEFATCVECIKARQLPMRLVGVDHLFSGEKIIFYFLADNRVDFRELVKDLARRYRTRIEMRQIGVRDEARLLADYEHCGRELCCRTFIRNIEPVTMRMAKMQKTTLDPSKISGHCGRLMCCLRFEDSVYSSLQADMPGRGALCVTDNFTGEVVATDVLRRLVTLSIPDAGQETVSLDDIREIRGRRGGRPGNAQRRNGNNGGGRAAAGASEADAAGERDEADDR
ncbi:MAG: hypothetical protein LBE84_12010 [Planctomycetota bacterium]|jgi:cell fate regulator YaaT (PSP1 superfamily)|nr:hypothetical protein [Planctomycetota bacterium]